MQSYSKSEANWTLKQGNAKRQKVTDTTRGKVIHSGNVTKDDTTNDDEDYHLIVDFSSDCDIENQPCEEDVPEPVSTALLCNAELPKEPTVQTGSKRWQ